MVDTVEVITATAPAPSATVVEVAASMTPTAVADLEVAKERDEYFTQYWQYATNLRNWFIAYGVGGILLLTRMDAVFNSPAAAHVEPGRKVQAIALFIFGLATQVLLTLLNKTAHYYAYQKYLDTTERRRHRWALQACGAFWIDFTLDILTLVWYIAGTIAMAQLL